MRRILTGRKFILCTSLMFYLLASLVTNVYAINAEADKPMLPLWTFKINEGSINLVDNQDPTAFATNHVYKLINKANSLVLDNWNSENGALCYSYIWTGVSNQKWKISTLNDESTYILENQRSGRVLDCYGMENNSDVYIWDNVSASDQQWKIESLNNGYFRIFNCKSNLALTQSIQSNGNKIFGINYVDAEQ